MKSLWYHVSQEEHLCFKNENDECSISVHISINEKYPST